MRRRHVYTDEPPPASFISTASSTSSSTTPSRRLTTPATPPRSNKVFCCRDNLLCKIRSSKTFKLVLLHAHQPRLLCRLLGTQRPRRLIRIADGVLTRPPLHRHGLGGTRIPPPLATGDAVARFVHRVQELVPEGVTPKVPVCEGLRVCVCVRVCVCATYNVRCMKKLVSAVCEPAARVQCVWIRVHVYVVCAYTTLCAYIVCAYSVCLCKDPHFTTSVSHDPLPVPLSPAASLAS